MQKIKQVFVITFLLLSVGAGAQQVEAVKNYINQYKDIAIQEMQRTGVPAAITLAQGIHESGVGQGRLATLANNHFGIKCKSNWTGESLKHDDDAKNECFRKYSSAIESYKDHSDFLKSGQRYAFLFQLEPTDYAGWANGLKQAGYATNPKYAPMLIKLIEDYQLQDYTLIALKGNAPVEVKAEEATIPAAAMELPKSISSISKNESKKTVSQPLYPSGEFKINDTKVIYARSGTSYLSIAQQYNVDLAKIFEMNDMKEAEEIEQDCLIYLQKKKVKGSQQFHIVQAGESLHDIAQIEAIRLKNLLEFNLLTIDMQPAPGERLSLQDKVTSAPKLLTKNSFSGMNDSHKSKNLIK